MVVFVADSAPRQTCLVKCLAYWLHGLEIAAAFEELADSCWSKLLQRHSQVSVLLARGACLPLLIQIKRGVLQFCIPCVRILSLGNTHTFLSNIPEVNASVVQCWVSPSQVLSCFAHHSVWSQPCMTPTHGVLQQLHYTMRREW